MFAVSCFAGQAAVPLAGRRHWHVLLTLTGCDARKETTYWCLELLVVGLPMLGHAVASCCSPPAFRMRGKVRAWGALGAQWSAMLASRSIESLG